MRTKYGVAIVATMLIGVLAGGCGDGNSEAPSALELATTSRDGIPFEQVVRITRSGYRPAEVQVLVGGTVTWVNLDPTKRRHTVETTDPFYKKLPGGADGSFDSHTLSWEEPYTVTFNAAGTYQYTSSYDGWEGKVTAVDREQLAHDR